MPYNGSGTFTRVHSWSTEATAGNPISSTKMDQEDDGFATGLSNCITKDGQTTVTQDIPFNSNKITGLADPSAAQDAATKNYVDTKEFATANYGDSSITRVKLVDSIIATDQLAANAVTGAKVTDGTLSNAKLANMAQYRVMGRVAAGSGAPQDLTPDQMFTLLGQATSDGQLSIGLGFGTANNQPAINEANGVWLNDSGYVSSYRTGGIAGYFGRDGDGNTVAFYRAGVLVGTISLSSGATAYNTSSDRRLKDDIDDLTVEDAERRFDRLKPRSFCWRDTGKRDWGFVADEFERAFPELVSTDPEDKAKLKQIAVSAPAVMASVVAVVRDLRARVARLEGGKHA